MHITQAEQGKIIALYCRWSREDFELGESNSIVHQKEILTKYARERGFGNTRFFVDDGISGAIFDQPGFQSMLAEVENDNVSTVIVKDMSRFGRNYLEVGMYTEITFPRHDVRFIAINDNVDSDRESGDNDLPPFKNLFNEWFSRDTSKKIRAVMKPKGASGKPLATHPPYGYMKDPDNKNRWVVDEEAAEIVRFIFAEVMNGKGVSQIARSLRERRVKTPAFYAIEHEHVAYTNVSDAPCFWTDTTVAKILSRQEYVGDIVNFKTYRKSYKQKKQLKNDPENYVIFSDVHEPIIDREVFETVQRIRDCKRRPTKMAEPYMFSGLVFCGTCRAKMYQYRTTSIPEEKWYFNCSTYRKKRGGCSAHQIMNVRLESLVLTDLRRVLALVQSDEGEFVRQIKRVSDAEDEKALRQSRRDYEQKKSRHSAIDKIIRRLYEDNVAGKVSDERFAKMSAEYETEQSALAKELADLEAFLQEQRELAVSTESFLKLVRKYTEIEKLDAEILRTFIEKVIIHHRTKGEDGKRIQQVDIYYNFIGKI